MQHSGRAAIFLWLVQTGANGYHSVETSANPHMSGISSVSGGQAALPYGGQQVRLRESKRAAEQAEQTAQTLRQKADEAQQDADRSQAAARGLGAKADQAESYASQVRRGTPVVEPKAAGNVAAPASTNANGSGLTAQQPQPAAGADPSAASGNQLPGVVNLRGQKLGQFINVTA
jgi:hypothetical protein